MLDFYARILGLAEERRVAQIGLIQLRAGASLIDLVPTSDQRIESGLNLDHFCLGVEIADFSDAIRYLRERDVEIVGEPVMRYGAGGMGLSIYLRDPESNVVELRQMVLVELA
jgi:glyoxylase I family protein